MRNRRISKDFDEQFTFGVNCDKIVKIVGFLDHSLDPAGRKQEMMA